MLKTCKEGVEAAHKKVEHYAEKAQAYEEDVEAAHKKVEYYADKAQAYEEDIEEMKKKMAEMEDEIASYEKKYGLYYDSCMNEKKCPFESVE